MIYSSQNMLLCLLSSVFCLLLGACASSPRPDNANIQITRPKSEAKMIDAVNVVIKSGRVPLVGINPGATEYGELQPGTFHLTAWSSDPYAVSELSGQTWQSSVYELNVEAGGYYSLEVVPLEHGLGWQIRPVRE